ncbi:MAG: hypothetical protein WC846_01395 [Candidatus Gracilibacteria bacterium]|jgi:hypothetical protein
MDRAPVIAAPLLALLSACPHHGGLESPVDESVNRGTTQYVDKWTDYDEKISEAIQVAVRTCSRDKGSQIPRVTAVSFSKPHTPGGQYGEWQYRFNLQEGTSGSILRGAFTGAESTCVSIALSISLGRDSSGRQFEVYLISDADRDAWMDGAYGGVEIGTYAVSLDEISVQ